jgi:hypothetical protein
MELSNIPIGLANKNVSIHSEGDALTYKYVNVSRVLWKTDGVSNDDILTDDSVPAQVSFDEKRRKCVIKTSADVADKPESILLDFGVEIHGFVQLFIKQIGKDDAIRVRFGESASEAMAEPGFKNAGNDHIRRDITYNAGFLSMPVFGPTGFRFVRIDLVQPNSVMILETVKAIITYRNIPYIGSFECSDKRINQIWETCAYTVHLNMQEYLWDGIKRDRLVWIGDMHPETSVIQAVFGDVDVVRKSLDFSRDAAPLPSFMNHIPAYSMWWIIIQHSYYMHYAKIEYLAEQREYLSGLTDVLCGLCGEDGHENVGGKFIDWPSSDKPQAQSEGIHALLYKSLCDAEYLLKILGEDAQAEKCVQATARLKSYKIGSLSGYKQSAALLSLAGLVAPNEANEVIKKDGAKGLSTFLGYYTLQAQALAGDVQGALDNIRTFWGAMLDRGATTFWEDFSIDWLAGSGRIDELVPDGVKDLHGDYGAYCYEKFRHSLCHGWSSGPAAFLAKYVLGIKPLAAGFEQFEVVPQLGDLDWAKGTYPTADGYISVSHVKNSDGTVTSQVDRIIV